LLAAAGPPGNDLDPSSDNTEKAAKEQVVPIPGERHCHAAIAQVSAIEARRPIASEIPRAEEAP
jgi:hypothetical protein